MINPIIPKGLRIVIYCKDVQLITGKSERSARRLLANIRKHFNKPTDALVTVTEFCLYTRVPLEAVIPYLR